MEQALGPYKGFINCDASLLLSDLLEALPSDKIVLEVLETVDLTPEIVDRCQALKALGYTLALDDFVNFEDKFTPLLDLVEIVKVDLMPLDPAGRTPPRAGSDDTSARRSSAPFCAVHSR